MLNKVFYFGLLWQKKQNSPVLDVVFHSRYKLGAFQLQYLCHKAHVG